MSMIQIRPEERGSESDAMRTCESRVTQLIIVCGHGALGIPRGSANKLRTRLTARNPSRATKNNWSAKKTQSTFPCTDF